MRIRRHGSPHEVFFTVGYSTCPIGEIIDLLTASEIGIVVDV
jgi:hypothetical protein